MSDAGLTLTSQQPVDADIRLVLDGRSPRSVFSSTLARSPGFVEALRQATIDAALQVEGTGTHVQHVLRAAGVTALDGAYADALAQFADASLSRGDRRPWLPVALTAAFGSASPGPFGFHQPFDGWFDGPFALLEAAEVTPTIAIVVDAEFRQQRRNQREEILGMIAALAHFADTHVIGSLLTRRWLANEHRAELPGVGEERSAGLSPGAVDAAVATAATELSVGDRAVRILELLADRDAETLAYHALDAELTVARETMRTHVKRLADLDLVSTFGPTQDRRVELTAAGRQFVDEEIAVQRRLTEGVGETRKPSADSRVSTRMHEGGKKGTSAAGTQWLDRSTHAAVAGAATQGGITLLDHPVERWDQADRGWTEPHLSVNGDRDEAVVGVEVHNPLQLKVSTALALFDPAARNRLWTDERLLPLEEHLDDARTALRDIRTLGWVGEDVHSAADYRDELGEAAQELRDLTRKLGTDDYEDRDQLRSTILQLANGLCGVASQLADLCDIALIYNYRVPEWRRNYDEKRRADLAETIAMVVELESNYSGHTTYRHLSERRLGKREQAFDVTVDAEDPTGDLTPSIVITGPGVDDFASDLQEAIDDAPVHEDAPEFGVDVPIRTALDHADWYEVLDRVAETKNLTARSEAVRTARALVGSPLDVADAVTRGLSREAEARDLRSDELRRALATLPTDRVLPDQPPTAGKIVRTLLDADQPLPKSVLAEAADVSERSIANNEDVLVELGLVEHSDAGYALRLSRDYTDPETWLTPASEEWTLLDGLYALAGADLPLQALSDPDHPIVGRLHAPGVPDLDDLRADWLALDRWIRVVLGLAGVDPPGAVETARLGQVNQQALAAAASDATQQAPVHAPD